MLQMMMKKVEAEGEKEKELFEKYMCYCKSSGGTLAKSIADAEAKIPQVVSDIEAAEAEMKQLKLDVEQHKVDRADAEKAMADFLQTTAATVLRRLVLSSDIGPSQRDLL